MIALLQQERERGKNNWQSSVGRPFDSTNLSRKREIKDNDCVAAAEVRVRERVTTN